MRKKKKILLALAPYWTPQVPPVGISCLKGYLQTRGSEVKTVDLNVVEQSRNIYNRYFDRLREHVSREKRGNFYNIGHDVMQNHLMAHLNYQDKAAYNELVKELIYQTFFLKVENSLVEQLNTQVEEFYGWLDRCILDILEREKPEILGMSVYRGNVAASLYAFKRTRQEYPQIATLMGGAIFAQALEMGTPNFQYFLERTGEYIDKIIVGEGELLFQAWIEGKLPEGQRVYTIKDLGGKVLPLDTAVKPDFTDLQLQFYPNLASYGSRSCPYRCSFCTETVYWGDYRKKKVTRVVEELSQLSRQYGSQLFLLCDSLLNPLITGLARGMIEAGTPVYWDGYLRVDRGVCQSENALLWRRGGFYRARLGIESGSPGVLDAMKKGINPQQIKAALYNLAANGIKTTTYWVVGYPGETEKDFQQTLDLLEEMKDYIYEAEANLFAYFLTGQADSNEWQKTHQPISLYPETARDMLMMQTWILSGQPGRQESCARLSRFVTQCSRLGIPNPYSLNDIHQADERWKKLHPRAVPSLLEFKNKEKTIDECRQVKPLHFAAKTNPHDMELGF